MQKVVIIGNGIAGVTAARHIRKNSDSEILIISAESDYFYSRTALMYIFMGHMRMQDTQPYEPWFYKKNRIDLKRDFVEKVNVADKSLKLASGELVQYDVLVLATGSKPNKFGWPGQDLKGVQGLYSLQDLELLEDNVKEAERAVLVGGGLIGIELAEMLLTRNIQVDFLVRESNFWGNVLPKEESQMIGEHMKVHHVNLMTNSELKEILDNGSGAVRGVRTEKGNEIDCQIVGLTAGVSPNIQFLTDSGIKTDRGIMVDRELRTNIENIYAIGDCAQFYEASPGRRNIEQVWYTGRMMGETVAQTICGNPTSYDPGPWFNSAKFFDIEYQTYGSVRSTLTEGDDWFGWKHPEENILIRVQWNKATKKFVGINVFGIRMRHELFDHWLKNESSIEEVMSALSTANFDPEFYKHHEDSIIAAFNQQTGFNIKLKEKKWWQNLLTKA